MFSHFYLHVLIYTTIPQYINCAKTVNLNGTHLRSSAVMIPPMLYMERGLNNSTVYRGIIKDIMDWLARELNITYTFVPVKEKDVATKGFTQALIDQLLNGEVDIVSHFLSPSYDRLEYMEFTTPLVMEPYRFIVPWPQEENRLLAPIRPFQPQVWLWLLLSVLAFVAGASMAHRLKSASIFVSWIHVINIHVLYTFNVFTRQGDTTPGKMPFRWLLSGMFCLMALVLVNTYSGILTSFLTVPTYKMTVNSFEDLADQSDIKLITELNGYLAKMILNSTTGPYKKLGDTLRANPGQLGHSREEIIQKILTSKVAYPGSESLVFFNINLLNGNGKCLVTTSKRLSLFLFHSFGLPKQGPYNKLINQQIQYLSESGLIDYWMKKYTPRNVRCLVHGKKETRLITLKLADVLGLFSSLGFGLGLSIVVLLLELLVATVKCNSNYAAFRTKLKVNRITYQNT